MLLAKDILILSSKFDIRSSVGDLKKSLYIYIKNIEPT